MTWKEFYDRLDLQYGATKFRNFYGELTKLQQVGSVRDYQTKFEKLLAKVGLLLQNRQVSHFIIHLKDSLKADVLSASPTTLASAIGLARLYEDRNLSVPQFPGFPELKKLSTFTKEAPSIGSGSSLLVKRLSPDEKQERRSKGLCYNYNEKFVPGHNCKKLFLLEVCEAEDNGDLVMDADHDTLAKCQKFL